MRRFVRALLAASLLVALGASCYSHQRLEAVRDRRLETGPAIPPEFASPLRDWRGILHCHSIYSHDAKGTLEEIGRAAEQTGVDFLVMTDHTNPDAFTHGWRGLHGKTLFLLGQEISKRGSIVAIGTKRFVDPKGKSAQAIVDDIVAAGGLAFIGHLEKTSAEGLVGLTGVGIVNLHAAFRDRGAMGFVSGIANLFWSGHSFPDEIFLETLSNPPLVEDNLRRFDALTRSQRLVAISETDAHGVARFAGLELDPYARLFRVVSTHVLAEELTEPAILGALAEGHAYVAFDGYAPSEGFAFEALRGSRVVAIQGDEATLDDGIDLLATLPFEARLRLVRNGETVDSTTGERLSHRATLPGVYRVEASIDLGDGQRPRPWIFSNPIYVR